MADDNFTFTIEKVTTATRIAKERAAAHWRNKEWFLWSNFGQQNQAVNPAWVDPYFENEWSYITNLPDTNPANLMTINAYFLYCWYKYKGYADYVIAALLYSHVVESKVTGGLWEAYTGAAGMHPFDGNAGNWLNGNGTVSYEDLKRFNPTLSPTSYTWFRGLQKAPETYVYYDPWSNDGGVTIGRQLCGVTEEGSYDSVRGPTGPDPDYIAMHGVSTPEGIKTYYYWRNSSVKRYTYYKGSFGYGLVQWTMWTEVRDLAGWLTGTFKSTVDTEYKPGYDPTTGKYYGCNKEWWLTTGNSRSKGIGQYHWQLNETLHLMILEFQRTNAMAASPIAHPELLAIGPNGCQYSEHGGGAADEGMYYGGWIDFSAKGATWDPDPHSPTYSTQHYDVGCTWDEWASGEFLTKQGVNQALLDQIAADPNPPYRKARLAMDILRCCYLRSAFNMPWKEALDYWLSCIEYWKDVWDIADIPRPREFPWLGFELDYYHKKQDDMMLLFAGRRKPHARRTLLF